MKKLLFLLLLLCSPVSAANTPPPGTNGQLIFNNNGQYGALNASQLRGVPSNQWTTLNAYGDQATFYTYYTPLSQVWPTLVNNNLGGSLNLYNDPFTFDCGIVNDEIMPNASPTQYNNPVSDWLPSVNDPTFGGGAGATFNAHRAITSACRIAGLTWLTTPSTYKILGQAFAQTGTWSNDSMYGGTYGILSSTQNSVAIGTTTTYGGAMYLLYKLHTIQGGDDGGTFQYSVDSGAYSANVPTDGGNAFGYSGTPGTNLYSVAAIKLPVASAGTHTVSVKVTSATAIGTNTVGIVGLLTSTGKPYLNPPTAFYAGQLYELSGSDTYATQATQLNADEQRDANALNSDGFSVQFVDLRGENYVNATTSMTGGSNYLVPNATGQSQIADAFMGAMQFITSSKSTNVLVDPRNFGATCTGYYGISSATVSAGGTGYAVNDTFNIAAQSGVDPRNATGIVTSVSSGVVTGFSITYAGSDYTSLTTASTSAITGSGTGLVINITGNAVGHDDTAGIVAALNSTLIPALNTATTLPGVNAAVFVPFGCYTSGFKMPTGTSLVNFQKNAHYGYQGLEAEPRLFLIGSPQVGVDISNGDVTLMGFEVSGFSSPSAYGTSTCIGVGPTGGAFGSHIESMSGKGCKIGFGGNVSGGEIFNAVLLNNDFAANGNCIDGRFSDYSQTHTICNSGGGEVIEAGSYGSYRFTDDRMEFIGTAYNFQGGGNINIINAQLDTLNGCAIQIGPGFNGALNMTNGFIQGPGSGGTLFVTGAANNGSGAIRLTVDSNNVEFYNSTATGFLTTGDVLQVSGVTGTTEANGQWTLTVVDGTHIDLQGSTFTNAYISGGIGAVNNKDAAICLNGSVGNLALSLTNVPITNALASTGHLASPAYLVDVQGSGANNDYVSINSPTLIKGTAKLNSYVLGTEKYQSTPIPHFNVSSNGYIFRNDTTQWSVNGNSIGIGTTAPNTLSALDMSYTTGAVILPNGTTVQEPSPGAAGMLRFNTSKSAFEGFSGSGWSTFGSPVPNSIGGLGLSNDATNPLTVFDVDSGSATSDDRKLTLSLSSPTTKTLGSWTVGSGNGCLDAGSVASGSKYHVYIIERLDTFVTDVLCSTSIYPLMPAAYAEKRIIGDVFTAIGTTSIRTFNQNGSYISLGTSVLDENSVVIGTTSSLLTLTVPNDEKVLPFGFASIGTSTAGVLLSDPFTSDIAVGTANPFTSAPGFYLTSGSTPGSTNTVSPILFTNTSAQIRARASAANTPLSFVTQGWINPFIAASSCPYTPPGDIQPIGAAYGFRLLSTSYVGRPIVNITRSSDGTNKDFAVYFPNCTIQQNDPFFDGSTYTLTKWYDQSGNGLAIGTSVGATVTLNCQNGQPCMNASPSRSYIIPETRPNATFGNLTYAAVFKTPSSGYGSVINLGYDFNPYNRNELDDSNNNCQATSNTCSGGPCGSVTSVSCSASTWTAAIATFNPSLQSVYANGSSNSTASPTTITSGLGYLSLGVSAFGANPLTGPISEVIVFSPDISSTVSNAITANQRSFWGF